MLEKIKKQGQQIYKTGDLMELFGVTSRTLYNWERRGWLVPSGRFVNGQKYYTKERVLEYLSKGEIVE